MGDLIRIADTLAEWQERADRLRAMQPPMSEADRLRLRAEDDRHDPNTPAGRRALRRRRMVAAGVEDVTMLDVVSEHDEGPPPPHGDRTVLEMVTRFAMSTNPGRTLALLGGTGRGKSFAAAWMLALREQGCWLDAGLIEPRPAWDVLCDRAREARVLVLDDVRVESDWYARQVERLIMHRHNAAKKTILTANWAKDEASARALGLPPSHTIQAQLGDAVWSRLSEDGIGGAVVVGGRDMRRRT